MKLTILVIEGHDKGKQQSFTEFPISIGRWPDNDFQLNDPSVSRRHCAIYANGSRLTVSDLKSTNKTILNKKILNSPKYFISGSEIIIGSNILRLDIGTPSGLANTYQVNNNANPNK